ncbi:hypothetical protein DWZ52_01445 [Collinsella sp. AF33-16]|nr:hypothetical protein DWZ52_01445 [Collinsella sp. AF33-16]
MLSFAFGTRDKLNRPARQASCGNMLPSKKYRAKGILAELLFAWVIQSMRAIYALLGTKECPGVPAGKEHP